MSELDAIVVGAGHNGLVAALVLARAGRRVAVVERASVIGGAARTEHPFARAPELPQSTGAYLLGLMPPELERLLDIQIPTVRRDPHYFLPTTGERFLLIGSDAVALEAQFRAFFSAADFRAHQALERELAELREDVAPSWLAPPLALEETAERYVRASLRAIFIDLCRGSVAAYLDRFGFESDLVKAMYGVTDGLSGLSAGYDSPGSGMNFLVHNMCRRPGSGGTFMLVPGGMGTIAKILREALERHGGRVVTNAPVESVLLRNGVVAGVRLEDGEELAADSVLVNADPFRMLDLVGKDNLPADYVSNVERLRRPGMTLKLNLALSAMPRFRCLPEPPARFGPTIHLLPDEPVVLSTLRDAFDAATNGRLPEFPSIEWYIHTSVDPALTDPQGRLSSALFVQWVPHGIVGSSWEAEGERYARHLLAICDRFAPGTSELVVDMQVLHPPAIERHFGITLGHIHHVDNSFGFAERVPHRAPIPGLYSASAGTHPAGSVIGCAGYLAAQACLEDSSGTPGYH
jgi:phytoene dehydrogenase-like protein